MPFQRADSAESRALLGQTLPPPPRLTHRSRPVDDAAGLSIKPAEFDLFAQLPSELVALLQEPKAFADDFTGVVVAPTLDFAVDEFLEFGSQSTSSLTLRRCPCRTALSL